MVKFNNTEGSGRRSSLPSFCSQLDLKLGESLHNSNLGSVSQRARSHRPSTKILNKYIKKTNCGSAGNKRKSCYIVHMTGLTFISVQWFGAEVRQEQVFNTVYILAGDRHNRKIHPLTDFFCLIFWSLLKVSDYWFF